MFRYFYNQFCNCEFIRENVKNHHKNRKHTFFYDNKFLYFPLGTNKGISSKVTIDSPMVYY